MFVSVGIQRLHRASPPFSVTCYLCLCLLAYNASTERLNPSLLPVTYVCVCWHTTPPQSVLTLPCYLLPMFVSVGIQRLHRASSPFPVTYVCVYWHTTPPQSVFTLPCYLLPMFVSVGIQRLQGASPPFSVTCYLCLCLLAYNASTERLNPSLLPVTYVCVCWHTTPPQSVLTLPCYLLPMFVSVGIQHLHRAS